MMKKESELLIKPIARHHAFFSLLLGYTLFLITLLLGQYFWQQARLPLILIILVSLVIIFIGIVKLSEPKFSFKLTPAALSYYHRYGQWRLEWQYISYISQLTETYGIDQKSLPYIGIRLTSLTPIVNSISPRLASRLIHEQRPLLAFCIRYQLLTSEQCTINFEPYIAENNRVLKGTVAAFLHHTEILKSALGYHLYLPQTALDREINDFSVLLKQCKNSAITYDN